MRLPFPKAEYVAAVERETATRTLAFADVPELVCGLPVRALMLQDVVVLDGVGSPFICGGVPSDEDIIIFLWLQSNEYCASQRKLKRFARRHRHLKYLTAVKAISAYVDEAYADAPKPDGGKESLPYCGWPAHLVDLFGREYGWSESDTLKCPLKRVFQYRKNIIKHHDPKAAFIYPAALKIRSEWLQSLNSAN